MMYTKKIECVLCQNSHPINYVGDKLSTCHIQCTKLYQTVALVALDHIKLCNVHNNSREVHVMYIVLFVFLIFAIFKTEFKASIVHLEFSLSLCVPSCLIRGLIKIFPLSFRFKKGTILRKVFNACSINVALQFRPTQVRDTFVFLTFVRKNKRLLPLTSTLSLNV